MKRYNTLSFHKLVLMILLLIHIAAVSLESPFNSKDILDQESIRFIIYSLIESILISGAILLTSLRFWHLFYDMKYITLCAKQRWYQIIDITIKHNNEKNDIAWFMKYKSTLGNYHFTIKIVYCLFIILPLCLHITQYIDKGTDSWFTITLAFLFAICNVVIPTVVLIIVKYQLKKLKFEDNFFIGLELTYEFWIWILLDIVQVAVWYTAIFIFDVDVNDYKSTEIILLRGVSTLLYLLM